MPELEETSRVTPVLSVVMPVYNERDTIERAVAEVQQEVLGKVSSAEFIIIEGSNDGTAAILDDLSAKDQRLRIIHEKPRGHGPALITGLNQSHGDYVFMIDGDMQIPASYFEKLWSEMQANNRDAIFGIRKNRQDPLTRLVLTRFVRLGIWLLCGVFIKDANVPFKIVRRSIWTEAAKVIPELTLTPSIFLAIYIKKRGYNVAMIEVAHRERYAGESTIRHWNLIKACAKALKQLVQFRSELSRMR